MATLPELIDAYLAGPAQLRAAVKGMTREQLLARPVTGRWSTLEVVAHLADFEPVFADRMKRIISHDNPLLMGADEQLFASKLAYHERDLEEELTLIDMTRRQMARILRALTPEALGRSGVHNERGLRTLQQFLEGAIGHIHHHLPFIEEKKKALGLAA